MEVIETTDEDGGNDEEANHPSGRKATEEANRPSGKKIIQPQPLTSEAETEMD